MVWLAEMGARVPAGMPAVIAGVGRLLRRGRTSRAAGWSRRIERVRQGGTRVLTGRARRCRRVERGRRAVPTGTAVLGTVGGPGTARLATTTTGGGRSRAG
ncbi:MAG: hypothetical protein WA731_21355 [Pseudonocardiaceae bacterium]